MKFVGTLVLAVSALLLSQTASAHRVYFEPQAKLAHPQQAPASKDYSFENPFILDNIWGSKALFGYLTANDVDVYAVSMAPFMPWTGETFFSRMLIALTLTPACNQTKNNYVNIALVGPGLPAPTGELPFAVPSGYGVVVKENPVVVGGEEREIFYETTTNISWFLPEGLSQECIEAPPVPFPMATCESLDNILGQPLLIPGMYYIVVWDEDGVPQDYTLSVGVQDSGYYVQTPDEPLTINNAHLHTPCTEPYPGH